MSDFPCLPVLLLPRPPHDSFWHCLLNGFVQLPVMSSQIPFRGMADEKPGMEAGDIVFQIKEKPHAEFKVMELLEAVIEK